MHHLAVDLRPAFHLDHAVEHVPGHTRLGRERDFGRRMHVADDRSVEHDARHPYIAFDRPALAD